MEHAASFFRTPLLAAVSLLFLFAALSGHPGLVDHPMPVEGSPTYLAVQHAHDAFSLDGATEAGDEASDTDEARNNILQANQIVAPTFYF